MSLVDVLSGSKKDKVMKETWGHLFPEEENIYYGVMIVAVGVYGECVIIKSNFDGLYDSPQRHYLEHKIFDICNFDNGSIYRVKCGLYFNKDDNEIIDPIIEKIKGVF